MSRVNGRWVPVEDGGKERTGLFVMLRGWVRWIGSVRNIEIEGRNKRKKIIKNAKKNKLVNK